MRRRYYRRKKGIAKKEKPFFKESSHAIQTKEEKRPFFQTKGSDQLTVGRVGDKYEVEADAMADAVMNNSPKSAEIQRKEITAIQRAAEEEEVQTKIHRQAAEEEPALQTQAAEEEEPLQMKAEEEEVQMQAEEEEVQAKSEEEEVQMQAEEEEVQAKSEEEEVQMQAEEEEVQAQAEEEEAAVQTKAAGKPKASDNLSSRIKQSSGNGQPLTPKTKQKMETAFDLDFGKVNIHTNSEAIQMNQELKAHAFTHGNDVYFNQGKYQPETSAGQHLLAHELTHVVQQKGHIQRKGENTQGREDVTIPSEKELLPGYTQCDFLDERIAHHAQRSLYNLYLQGGVMRMHSLSILSAVKSGKLKGIFKEDYGKPALLARRHGTSWWELIPKGRGAKIITFEEPPMMVYKNNIATNRPALAGALFSAWEASTLSEQAHIIAPPSFQDCPIVTHVELPPDQIVVFPDQPIEGKVPPKPENDCDKEKLNKLIQQCVDTAKIETYKCHARLKLPVGWKGVKDLVGYYACMKKIEKNLLICDKLARQASNCP